MKKPDYFYIACMPTMIMATPPEEQQDCIKEKCQDCLKEIWVSVKKREMRRKTPQSKTICLFCAAKLSNEHKHNGDDVEVIDLHQPH